LENSSGLPVMLDWRPKLKDETDGVKSG
jgi:hypothetical protein